MRKTFEIYSRCVNMNIIKPQEETENEIDDIIPDIPTPKIDTWASNKTKINIVPKEQKNQELERKESIISNKFKSLTTNKKKEKEEEEKKKLLLRKSTTIKSIGGKGGKGIGSPEGGKEVKVGLTLASKKVKEPNLVDIHPQFQIENLEKEEELDELDALRDRGLRIYFKERELEKQRKIKIEQELEEYEKEAEKNKKKVGNDDYYKKPYYYNNEGKLLYVKVPDLENIKLIAGPIYTVENKGDAKVNEEIADLVSKNPLSLFEQDPNTIDKTKIAKPDSTVVDRQTTVFFQPDPYESHQIEKGVTMRFYEQTKKGGEFPEIPGRMTDKDFQLLVKQMKPKQKNLDMLRVFDDDGHNMGHEDDSQINIPTNLLHDAMDGILDSYHDVKTKESRYSNRNLINLMYEDDRENNNNKEKKLKKEFKSLEFFSPQKRLKLIKKMLQDRKKLLEEEKRDHVKITGDKNFKYQYETMEKLTDARIYDNFTTDQRPKNVQASTSVKFHNPINPHVDYEKELGHMKKYPRERISKDILANTGRMALAVNVNDISKSKFDKSKYDRNQQNTLGSYGSKIIEEKSKIK